MSRGVIRSTTAAEAVERMRTLADLRIDPPRGGVGRHLAYRLKRFNGGKDPYAPHPGTWARDWKRWCSDCVGTVVWALGFDRYQPEHFDCDAVGRVIYGGWINTDSMIIAAHSPTPTWFEVIDRPELAAIAVYGSTFARRRRRPGHVALVTEIRAAEWDDERPQHELVRVMHCSSSAFRRTGNAITETDATLWRRRGGLWLRYLRYDRTSSPPTS